MAVEKLMIIVPPAVSSEAIKPKTNMPTGAITVLAEASRQVEVELLDTVAAGFEKRLNDPEYQLERSFAVDECDVKLVGLSVKEIVERVRRSAADVIGISCLTLTDLPQTRVITDAIREALPKIPIIVGGSEFINYHPEFGHFRELPSVDYLGIGPGQRLINSFLDYLNSPTGSRPQGIVFKDGYYKPFQTQFDPNQFALPDYSLLPTVDIGGSKSLDLYSKIGMTHAGDHKILFGQENMPYLPIVTSYGCPHECKFCDPESQHTQYTPENIMTMLDQAKQLFGLGYVDLLDNNFAGRTTQSRAKAFAILDAIKQLQLKIGFSKCRLDSSVFFGLNLTSVQMINCVAKDVDFTEANLTKAKLNCTDLSSSTFAHTNLTYADLSYAKNYSIDPNCNTLKKTIFTLPEAVSLLNTFDIILK